MDYGIGPAAVSVHPLLFLGRVPAVRCGCRPKTPWLHARALRIVATDGLSFHEWPADSLADLVPNPAVPVQDTATTSSPVPNSTGPPQSGGGPLSRTHVVPPRPKPGRKPATEEPESKRKAQNRASQRNFRQRKQKTVLDLQASLNLANEKLKETSTEFARASDQYAKDIEFLHARIEDLERTNNELRAELEQCKAGGFHRHAPLGPIIGQPQSISVYDPRHDVPFRRAFDTDFDAQALVPSPQPTDSGCDRCTKDHCACLAEMTNDVTFDAHGDAMTGILRDGQGESDQEKPRDHSEFETDFTSAFRKPKPHEANPAELLPSGEDTKFPDCGFCTGQPESCICRSMRAEAGDATSSLARVVTASSAEDVKPNLAMSGPGSCADCQANPEQRAWCQRVAQLRSEATPPNSRRNSGKSVTLGTMEPKASTSIEMSNPAPSPNGRGETVGCSDAFKLLVGRVDTEMDWRQLKPVPPTFAQEDARRNTFTMEPGMYSAMELDASSILTTLQHAPGPIKPRPSDGTYARLVQEAEERRRKSSTPMKKTVDHHMLDAKN
uniref:Iron-responsive transcription factor n=1 Tax=Cochliobolus lunatus TaxID=5503 RepID=A0A411F6X9_COCLU|nr:iron-responsive transcription factor [Curvularia lunata]